MDMRKDDFVNWLGNSASDNQKDVIEWFMKRFPENEVRTQSELTHLVDYFRSDESPKMLMKLTWKQAFINCKKWDEKREKAAQKRKELEEDPDATFTVQKFPDEWRWVRLLTQEAYQYEGDKMGHCVVDYYKDIIGISHSVIYSLRDTKNRPHATLEVAYSDWKSNEFPNQSSNHFDHTLYSVRRISQIRGKENKPVVAKYLNKVREFIKVLELSGLATSIDDHEVEAIDLVDTKELISIISSDKMVKMKLNRELYFNRYLDSNVSFFRRLSGIRGDSLNYMHGIKDLMKYTKIRESDSKVKYSISNQVYDYVISIKEAYRAYMEEQRGTDRIVTSVVNTSILNGIKRFQMKEIFDPCLESDFYISENHTTYIQNAIGVSSIAAHAKKQKVLFVDSSNCRITCSDAMIVVLTSKAENNFITMNGVATVICLGNKNHFVLNGNSTVVYNGGQSCTFHLNGSYSDLIHEKKVKYSNTFIKANGCKIQRSFDTNEIFNLCANGIHEDKTSHIALKYKKVDHPLHYFSEVSKSTMKEIECSIDNLNK